MYVFVDYLFHHHQHQQSTGYWGFIIHYYEWNEWNWSLINPKTTTTIKHSTWNFYSLFFLSLKYNEWMKVIGKKRREIQLTFIHFFPLIYLVNANHQTVNSTENKNENQKQVNNILFGSIVFYTKHTHTHTFSFFHSTMNSENEKKNKLVTPETYICCVYCLYSINV